MAGILAAMVGCAHFAKVACEAVHLLLCCICCKYEKLLGFNRVADGSYRFEHHAHGSSGVCRSGNNNAQKE